MRRSCTHPGCLNQAIGKNCRDHRKATRINPEAHFWAGVRKLGPNDCWPWLRGRIGEGYGIAPWNGRQTTAHRVAYMYARGPIPDDHQIDHLCHNEKCTAGANCPHRRCCNPAHLKPVTLAENLAPGRMYRPPTRNSGVTHCPRGHEYTPENTRVASHGGRNCRTCERNRRKKH